MQGNTANTRKQGRLVGGDGEFALDSFFPPSIVAFLFSSLGNVIPI